MKSHSCNQFINNVIIIIEAVISWFDSTHYLMNTIILIGMGFYLKTKPFYHEPPYTLPTRSGYLCPTYSLTHWGRVTHICVSKLTIIGSDNGLSPDRRQAIIWTNAGLLLIEPLGTNFSEILIEIPTFSFKKMRVVCETAAILSRPQCVKWLYTTLSCPVAAHYMHTGVTISVSMTIWQHWFRRWLGAEQATSHFLN